ncbi:hypothetical protein ATANTOWER_011288 [Ataeniobius toweri]|uniref:Uncharacterized protein n=1 Tax=Ataeniobius toweri TaxID=208326 RepID=A0ABU7AGP2_9TELE|nr:hypothetical protein [Ataeniobius toweri]
MVAVSSPALDNLRGSGCSSQPQPLWFAHLSLESPPSPTMSCFRKPTGYRVLTLPRKHLFNKPACTKDL